VTTTSFGNNGFKWFFGVVEDRNDPEKLGRLKVRVHGLHSDTTLVPTETLPWAHVLMPLTSASLKGVGMSPVGVAIGTTVMGFFMDGAEGNMPIIMGTLPGESDVPNLALGQMTLVKDPVNDEPESPFGAVYPYNKVFRSESGHVIEIDDTPNRERLHLYHRTGTFTEVHPDGTTVNHIIGNGYEIVERNGSMTVKGNVSIQVDGDYDLNVKGNIRVNGNTINLNKGTMGAARIGDNVPDSEVDGTQAISEGSATVFIGD
jgi:hypothetical protein